MALLDSFDRRALALFALPAGAFIVLLVRCLLPPAIGMAAALPFAGVLLLSYGPLAYLGLFRAWGDLWPDDAEPSCGSAHPPWWQARWLVWSDMQQSGLHVLGTLWIAYMHWALIDGAKKELEGPATDDALALFLPREPPPTGLDLFGEMLVIMGIVVPLILIGLMWIILPRRP